MERAPGAVLLQRRDQNLDAVGIVGHVENPPAATTDVEPPGEVRGGEARGNGVADGPERGRQGVEDGQRHPGVGPLVGSPEPQ